MGGRDLRGGRVLAVLAGIVLVVPAVSSLPVASIGNTSSGTVSDECIAKMPHPPIRITEETGPQGFILGYGPDGEPIHRPGSGVVNGTGTAENPYVIEGWCITPQVPDEDETTDVPLVGTPTATPVSSTGIVILNTTAHVVIRDNVVDGHALDAPEIDDQQEVGILISNAENVTLASSTITNNLEGVHLFGSQPTVQDNTIKHNSGVGIRATATQGAIIENNSIAKNGAGIRMTDVDNVKIKTNMITDNKGEGIHLDHSRDPLVQGNKIGRNGWRGDGGIVVTSSKGGLFSNNLLSQNIRQDILLASSTQVQLRNNTIVGEGVIAGLAIEGTDPSHYQHIVGPSNTVNGDPIRFLKDEQGVEVQTPAAQVFLVNTTKVRVHGLNLSLTPMPIVLLSTNDTTVANNSLSNNARGILSMNSSYIKFRHNRVGSNTGAALEIRRSATVRIRNNSLTENWDSGLYMKDTVGANVANNTIQDNSHGIQLVGSREVIIRGNSIVQNPFAGVELKDSGEIRIAGNKIEMNGRDGMLIRDSSQVQARHNTIRSNDQDGVAYVDSSSSFENNTVSDNTFAGVSLDGSGATISSNAIHSNGDGLILSSSGGSIWGNNIYSNTDAGLIVSGSNSPITAQDNWWGHSSGPSGGIQDACTGEKAVGAGETIEITFLGGEVCFDPWLTSPNPNAGAD